MEIAKLAKDIESEDSKIEERESRTAQNLMSEVDENQANTRLKNAQANKLEQEADLSKLQFVRTADGSIRNEQIEDKEAEWLNAQELDDMKMAHQRELEAIKAKMKEAELALNDRIANTTLAVNTEKDLPIADMKARELASKSMDRIANQKGDRNGKV
jgi:hypothetical protein